MQPQAVLNWQTQNYPRSELVVIDDGEDSVEDLILPDTASDTYLCPPAGPSVQSATWRASKPAGDFVLHWDDDD